MKLDLRTLLSGEKKELPIDFSLAISDVDDPMSSLYGVRFLTPLSAVGRVVNNAGYMQLLLTVSASYTGTCARCLSPVDGDFRYALEKTVVPSGMLLNISEEEADDYAIVHDGFLDMDEELLELLELAFPSKLLCQSDCKGLCPTCGKNLNTESCSCDTHEIDPRLAGLQELYRKLKAEEDAENASENQK